MCIYDNFINFKLIMISGLKEKLKNTVRVFPVAYIEIRFDTIAGKFDSKKSETRAPLLTPTRRNV